MHDANVRNLTFVAIAPICRLKIIAMWPTHNSEMKRVCNLASFHVQLYPVQMFKLSKRLEWIRFNDYTLNRFTFTVNLIFSMWLKNVITLFSASILILACMSARIAFFIEKARTEEEDMIRQAEKKAHMIDCRVIFNGGWRWEHENSILFYLTYHWYFGLQHACTLSNIKVKASKDFWAGVCAVNNDQFWSSTLLEVTLILPWFLIQSANISVAIYRSYHYQVWNRKLVTRNLDKAHLLFQHQYIGWHLSLKSRIYATHYWTYKRPESGLYSATPVCLSTIMRSCVSLNVSLRLNSTVILHS